MARGEQAQPSGALQTLQAELVDSVLFGKRRSVTDRENTKIWVINRLAKKSLGQIRLEGRRDKGKEEEEEEENKREAATAVAAEAAEEEEEEEEAAAAAAAAEAVAVLAMRGRRCMPKRRQFWLQAERVCLAQLVRIAMPREYDLTRVRIVQTHVLVVVMVVFLLMWGLLVSVLCARERENGGRERDRYRYRYIYIYRQRPTNAPTFEGFCSIKLGQISVLNSTIRNLTSTS